MPTHFNPYEINQQQFNYGNMGGIAAQVNQKNAGQGSQYGMNTAGGFGQMNQQFLAQKYGTPKADGSPIKGADAMGKSMAVLGGVTGMVGQLQGMNADWKNLQFSNAAQETDAYGRPIYTGGQLASEIGSFKPQKTGADEVLQGVGGGATAGAAFGPLGAAFGGAVGGLVSLIGGRRRRKKQEEKFATAKLRLKNAQGQFNEDASSFEKLQNSQDFYNQQYNDYNQRVNNLYRTV